MITGNVGDATPKGVFNLSLEMAAFDALPVAFRERLRTMTEPWAAIQVAATIKARGETFTMAMLNKIEDDARDAHRKKYLHA